MRRDIHVFVDGRADDSPGVTGIKAFQVGATSNKTDTEWGTGNDQTGRINFGAKLQENSLL